MKPSNRTLGTTIGVVALVLTGLGVYWAAADTNPAGLSDSALALHGRPATTATMALSLSTGDGTAVTGLVNVNFKTNELSGTVSIPTIFSTTNYNVVLTNTTLYLGVPSLESLVRTPWVSVRVSPQNLSAGSLIVSSLADALSGLFTGRKVTVTHAGPFTTYAYEQHLNRAVLHLPSDLPLTLPKEFALTIRVTVASAGQLAAVSVAVASKQLNLLISLKVLAYDRPVTISAPPRKDVQPLTKAITNRVLGPNSKLGKFLTTGGITSLSRIRVS